MLRTMGSLQQSYLTGGCQSTKITFWNRAKVTSDRQIHKGYNLSNNGGSCNVSFSSMSDLPLCTNKLKKAVVNTKKSFAVDGL